MWTVVMNVLSRYDLSTNQLPNIRYGCDFSRNIAAYPYPGCRLQWLCLRFGCTVLDRMSSVTPAVMW
jgi:hypothetical protein